MTISDVLTWAEALSKPDEVPSGSGNVSSAANSKPTGKYPVMKNLLHAKQYKLIIFKYIIQIQILLFLSKYYYQVCANLSFM